MKNIITPIILSALVFPLSNALADVTSQPCPYSCQTRGLSKDQCKDWREGNTCYVETNAARDRTGEFRDQARASMGRKILMVNKELRDGSTVSVDLPDSEEGQISRIDVVVRREGDSRETKLGASLDDKNDLGVQQVDKNENHVLSFQFPSNSDDDDVTLEAVDGDLFVESVHVLHR